MALLNADTAANSAGTGAMEFTKGFKVPVARYKRSTAFSLAASDNTFDWPTSDYDNYSAVTTGASWKFTAPIAGKYRVSFVIYTSGGAPGFNGSSNQITARITKNGSTAQFINAVVPTAAATRIAVPGTGVIDLSAADQISVVFNSNVAYSTDADATFNWVAIEYVGV
jgi:hypothetical protein